MMAARNSRHDHESVTEAALTLLDQVGLPDLSMRRLAAELEVQPSALYWHFTSKQQLLAAVADRIVARIPTTHADAQDLEARLLLTARSIRDALLSYRDGAEIVLSTAALRLGAQRAHDIIVEALRDDDLGHRDGHETSNEMSVPDLHRTQAASVILQFVLGHTTLLQQRMHADSHGASADDSPSASGSRMDTSADEFDAGITLIAAGLRARLPQPPAA